MTLALLRINTILFLVLLMSTATIAKANETKFKLLKQDNEHWKNEVRELLYLLQKYSENNNLWMIDIKDLLHKMK